MVNISSTRRSPDCKVRFTWPCLIILLRFLAIGLALAAYVLFDNLRASTAQRDVIPSIEDEASGSSAAGRPSSSSQWHDYKSFPGLAKKAIEVACGGHMAASCDQCPQGNGASWCNGDCEWRGDACVRSSKLNHVHPDYFRIVQRYAFQPVINNNGEYVNVILVRSPFHDADDNDLYEFYKDDILFMGISSFESFPLNSPNPYSHSNKNEEEIYLNFPGFLHMMRDPDEHFPRHVKRILMSQSDFNLDVPERFGREHAYDEKIYDFVYSGGDQDVESDCVGWASYNKNFSFVREALEVMCSPEFNVTGVLVANKNKADTKACTIPDICHGKILQTTFLGQDEFFGYIAKARWVFLPQVCDASPRVSTQGLAMNKPLLMNRNIMGGWKYLIPGQTGEFFHDMSDFRDSLRRILDNTRGDKSPYKPLDLVKSNYGNEHSGKRLYDFVKEHWGDKIIFPVGTNALIPTGV
ncbi:hypothetical protein ACHAXA_008919 [Cyclostephanos tholiformis]|uniref:Uncharacterized protein n=1 Tax=Cyclostephanos tholiformis TaxID=382380 RepID=A0ABD3R3E5_9STRA